MGRWQIIRRSAEVIRSMQQGVRAMAQESQAELVRHPLTRILTTENSGLLGQ